MANIAIYHTISLIFQQYNRVAVLVLSDGNQSCRNFKGYDLQCFRQLDHSSGMSVCINVVPDPVSISVLRFICFLPKDVSKKSTRR